MNQEVQALLDITRDVTTSFDTDLNESLLIEKSRQDLLNKSRTGATYRSKDRQGQNRYTRRLKSQIANSVRDYNRIDMDAFWKGDILDFDVRVHGETDNYIVSLTFSNILNRLQQEVKSNNNKLEFKCVFRALVGAFNSENDLLVGCTCPDFKYRFQHYATRDKYNANTPELRPNRFAWTNSNDDMGSACKHVNLVLSNVDWMMKIASVINNYIKWCKLHMERNYADYIFPKVYGMPYNKAVQLSIFDNLDDEESGLLLPKSTMQNKAEMEKALGDIIDDTAMKGRNEKGQWEKGNQYRFQKQEKEPESPEDNPDQLKLDFDDKKEKELNLKFEKEPTEENKEDNIKFEK